MKIRQESAIRRFLTEALGNEWGRAVIHRQQIILQALMDAMDSKTKNQRRTLARTILPRIALYTALSQDGVSQKEAYGAECLRRENSALRAAGDFACGRKDELLSGILKGRSPCGKPFLPDFGKNTGNIPVFPV